MAFKNEQQLRTALTWFDTNGPMLLRAELVGDMWRDDHALCMKVNFGGAFEYTFLWMADEFIWHLARCHEDLTSALIVWEGILNAFGAEGDGIYTYEDTSDEVDLPEDLMKLIAQLKTKVKELLYAPNQPRSV